MFCSSEFMYQMPGDFQQQYDIGTAAEVAGYQHNTTNVLSHYQQQQQQQNDMSIYNSDRPSPSFRIDDILVQKGNPYAAAMYSNSGHFGQYGSAGFHSDKDYQGMNFFFFQIFLYRRRTIISVEGRVACLYFFKQRKT